MNLRRRFAWSGRLTTLKTRLVVIALNGRTVGLLVDTAKEFLNIPAEAIKPPPDAITGLSGKYLESIATLGDRLILILNVDEVLNFHESEPRPKCRTEELNSMATRNNSAPRLPNMAMRRTARADRAGQRRGD